MICENCEDIDHAPGEAPYCHVVKSYLETEKDGKAIKAYKCGKGLCQPIDPGICNILIPIKGATRCLTAGGDLGVDNYGRFVRAEGCSK